MASQISLSVIVPAYNESAGLAQFHAALLKVIQNVVQDDYEILYCDDGSTDTTAELVHSWHHKNKRIKLISLSRNFGKEIAVSAGLHAARGQVMITIDADGQHPVELLPQFVDAWRAGSKVVTGLRVANQNEGLVKRYGSKLFYALFNRLTGIKVPAGATDFRLIDQRVQQEFVRLTERRRMTRALIDWLGYPQTYITFTANPRISGEAGYSVGKLLTLAIDSTVSMSLSPLYVTAYIGAIILPLATILGVAMLLNALIGDPLSLHATGGAYVMVLLLFLIGILLVSQGIIGLYLSHIHTETQNRPLYIIDDTRSLGVDNVFGRS